MQAFFFFSGNLANKPAVSAQNNYSSKVETALIPLHAVSDWTTSYTTNTGQNQLKSSFKKSAKLSHLSVNEMNWSSTKD